MEFVLVIISILACFAAGFVLLKPETRRAFPTGFLGGAFYAEGLWLMLNHIISGIWADNHIMAIIKCIIDIIAAAGTIYSIAKFTKIINRRKRASRKSANEEENQ
ncbi:MAG: hypothetical protein K6F76_01935 [Clostridiales bacterium]|nr:hypothetical protein [Clostridiales bacterium]